MGRNKMREENQITMCEPFELPDFTMSYIENQTPDLLKCRDIDGIEIELPPGKPVEVDLARMPEEISYYRA